MKNRQTTSRSIVKKVSNRELLFFWQHLKRYNFAKNPTHSSVIIHLENSIIGRFLKPQR
jgi:hypothetical protein